MTQDIKKILVVHTGGFKDFVASLPAMSRIHNLHNKDDITLMTCKPFVDLARQCGYFDKIWEVRLPHSLNIPAWFALKRRCKSFGFDKTYKLEPAVKSIQSAALPPSDGVIAKNWCDQNLDYFQVPKNYALLAPSGRGRFGLPVNRMGSLAKKLALEGITPVLIGTAEDSDTIKRIHKICPEAVDLCRQTNMSEIAGLAHNARFMIGHVSGIAALASFANCRVLCLVSDEESLDIPALQSSNVILYQNDFAHISVKDIMDVLREKDWL